MKKQLRICFLLLQCLVLCFLVVCGAHGASSSPSYALYIYVWHHEDSPTYGNYEFFAFSKDGTVKSCHVQVDGVRGKPFIDNVATWLMSNTGLSEGTYTISGSDVTFTTSAAQGAVVDYQCTLTDEGLDFSSKSRTTGFENSSVMVYVGILQDEKVAYTPNFSIQ